MAETKIFCSVIIFTLGIYTFILLQYELSKLNQLTNGGGGERESDSKHHQHLCNVTKTNFTLDKVNCGSAGYLSSLKIRNCSSQLPCDILPNVNYSVELNFTPSRNISSLEIQTIVRQGSNLKYLHRELVHTSGKEGQDSQLKFSFLFPPHPVFTVQRKMMMMPKHCALHWTYLLGVEIWDLSSGIGEICLMVPITVFYA